MLQRALLLSLTFGVWAQGQSEPVYYDYPENGRLTGGNSLIDRKNPADRAAFGLGVYPKTIAWPVTTVIDNGPSANRVDLVMLGDGYTTVELAVHEFRHSSADLADEYDYGDGAVYSGPEPVEADVSKYDEPTQISLQVKWYLWMDLPNVSTFEGAYCKQYGIYRPTLDSKMRTLDRPFEEIDSEQLILSVYEIVSPIDNGRWRPPMYPARRESLSRLT